MMEYLVVLTAAMMVGVTFYLCRWNVERHEGKDKEKSYAIVFGIMGFLFLYWNMVPYDATSGQADLFDLARAFVKLALAYLVIFLFESIVYKIKELRKKDE